MRNSWMLVKHHTVSVMTAHVILGMLLLCAGAALASRKTGQDKRSDDTPIGALVVQVGQLASQLNSLTAEVTALRNQVSSQQALIDTLNKNVAFYAVGGSGPVNATGLGTIIFSNTLTNVGSGYDAQTGFFTAPSSGLYQFTATFMAYRSPATYVHADIRVDGILKAVSISDSRHGFYDHVSLHTVVHVSAGQRVTVHNTDNKMVSYYGGSYLSFSGVLLHAD